MRSVLYPGSFDPFTNGHLDLALRASRLFDRVVIGIGVNTNKKPFFTLEERKAMIEATLADRLLLGTGRFEVTTIEGLMVGALSELKVDAVLRGLRAFSDFEHEMQMAEMNRDLSFSYETIFMLPQLDLSFVSSSAVKELACFGADVTPYVPKVVAAALKDKVEQLRRGITPC